MQCTYYILGIFGSQSYVRVFYISSSYDFLSHRSCKEISGLFILRVSGRNFGFDSEEQSRSFVTNRQSQKCPRDTSRKYQLFSLCFCDSVVNRLSAQQDSNISKWVNCPLCPLAPKNSSAQQHSKMTKWVLILWFCTPYLKRHWAVSISSWLLV